MFPDHQKNGQEARQDGSVMTVSVNKDRRGTVTPWLLPRPAWYCSSWTAFGTSRSADMWIGTASQWLGLNTIAITPGEGHFGLEGTVRPLLAFYNQCDKVEILVRVTQEFRRH